MNPPGQLIRDAVIVNEGKQKKGAVLIRDGKIADIFDEQIPEALLNSSEITVYSAEGLHLLPGVIDDQVHFRDPGMTIKGDIRTESRAAVAGGVTSFMDMPNTVPPTVTQETLAQKFKSAEEKSLANYSFYLGATNDNIAEILKTDFSKVCGVKMFMGSSTGNLLVDNPDSLEDIFHRTPTLLAVHCEKDEIIRSNTVLFRERYGDNMPVSFHPLVRSEEACYASTLQAVSLAKKYNTRLHVLHLSTAKETGLFDRRIPLSEKRITAEVCVHHLWFCDADYRQYGTAIKWNPAIKTAADRDGLLQALLDGAIDVVATDHAPHTWEEKQRGYFKTPSGGPLIQHSLTAMLELAHCRRITVEQVVEKMCHHPALLFGIRQRGFIRKGYWADLVLVDMHRRWTVTTDNILYKCRWSPFLGQQFHSSPLRTWVNGRLVYDCGQFDGEICGKALEFDR